MIDPLLYWYFKGYRDGKSGSRARAPKEEEWINAYIIGANHGAFEYNSQVIEDLTDEQILKLIKNE